jgi:hypothetical protein
MSASCCDQAVDPHRGDERYRRVLWAVLAINVAMFAVEVAADEPTPKLSLDCRAALSKPAADGATCAFVVSLRPRRSF